MTATIPARILVVEDDRRTADVIALYLRHAGHRVAVEHDGHAAIARARREAFDLLILDRMLPGADGLEIEVHIDPPAALSDKAQQLSPEAFARLMRKITTMRRTMDELAEEDRR